MTPDAFRRAALSIYTLAHKDRQWVLGRLPDNQRAHLQRLLAELKGAGMSALQVKDLLAQDDQLLRPQQPRVDIGREVEIINAATAEEITAIVAGEPEWAVAVLLANYRWHWAEEYLVQLEALRRGRLLKAIREVAPSIKPKTRRAIISIVATRLSETKQSKSSVGDFEDVFRRADRRAVKQQSRRG